LSVKIVINELAGPWIQAKRHVLPLEPKRPIAGSLGVSAETEHPSGSGTYAPNLNVLAFAIQLDMEVAHLSSADAYALQEASGVKAKMLRSAASLKVKACLAF
jgi:hypothetical protein